MSDLDKLRDEAQRALGEAAKSALVGSDDETRAKRKKWLAIAAVAGGGLGLIVLWSLASKIGYYLLLLLFFGSVFAGGYYLLKSKYEAWQQQRLAAKTEKKAVTSESDKRAALEAELEALKRKAR